MNTIDKLLKMDAGKVKMPEKVIKMNLTKLGGEEFEFPCVGISPEKYSRIQENVYEFKKGNIKGLNMHDMKTMTVVEGCPSVFKSKEIMSHFGCPTPKELVCKLMLSGEIDDLKKAIEELNGYESDDDEDGDDEDENSIKN